VVVDTTMVSHSAPSTRLDTTVGIWPFRGPIPKLPAFDRVGDAVHRNDQLPTSVQIAIRPFYRIHGLTGLYSSDIHCI
jgi:hypothetical protein